MHPALAFKAGVDPLILLLFACIEIPEVQFWCDTCQILGSQYDTRDPCPQSSSSIGVSRSQNQRALSSRRGFLVKSMPHGTAITYQPNQ